MIERKNKNIWTLCNIKGSREDIIQREEEIDKKIKGLPRSLTNLSYIQKRKIVLKQMNNNSEEEPIKEQLDLQNNRIKLFNISSLRIARDACLLNKIAKIKDNNLTEMQKKLKVLNDLNSSETYEYEEKKESSIIIEPILTEQSKNNDPKIQINEESHSDFDSTMDTTQSKVYFRDYSDPNVKLWIDYKYYDLTEAKEKEEKVGRKCLYIKDNKNTEYFTYLYDNNFKTYNYTISQILGEYKSPPQEIKDEKFNKEYGFFFCGKNIEKYNKVCKIDEMMCDECMEKNLKMYNLNKKKHALINIKGRASFNNFKDKKFHCLGKFKINKEIKICISDEFCCKSCSLLNKTKEYYNKK